MVVGGEGGAWRWGASLSAPRLSASLFLWCGADTLRADPVRNPSRARPPGRRFRVEGPHPFGPARPQSESSLWPGVRDPRPSPVRQPQRESAGPCASRALHRVFRVSWSCSNLSSKFRWPRTQQAPRAGGLSPGTLARQLEPSRDFGDRDTRTGLIEVSIGPGVLLRGNSPATAT